MSLPLIILQCHVFYDSSDNVFVDKYNFIETHRCKLSNASAVFASQLYEGGTYIKVCLRVMVDKLHMHWQFNVQDWVAAFWYYWITSSSLCHLQQSVAAGALSSSQINKQVRKVTSAVEMERQSEEEERGDRGNQITLFTRLIHSSFRHPTKI